MVGLSICYIIPRMITRFVVYLLAEYDNDVLESSRFKFILRFKSNNLRTVGVAGLSIVSIAVRDRE